MYLPCMHSGISGALCVHCSAIRPQRKRNYLKILPVVFLPLFQLRSLSLRAGQRSWFECASSYVVEADFVNGHVQVYRHQHVPGEWKRKYKADVGTGSLSSITSVSPPFSENFPECNSESRISFKQASMWFPQSSEVVSFDKGHNGSSLFYVPTFFTFRSNRCKVN